MMNIYLGLRRRWLLMVVMWAASAAALAQPQDAASVDAILRQSQAILRQIDAGDAPAVWEAASPVMRESIKKDEFTANVPKDRAGMGAIAARAWQMVGRAHYAEGNTQRMPPGDYVNVNYVAADQNGQSLHELISFRLESGGQWRMTGYFSRRTGAK